ncbi:MAG: hypothetical protein QW035_01745 [Candidatus Anstonellales archaeon]
MNFYKILPLLFVGVLFLNAASALVVTNSADGRDTVSAIYYANVKGEDIRFATRYQNAEMFFYKVGTQGRDILYIESKNYPIFAFAKEKIAQTNTIKEEIISEDPYKTNQLLAKKSGAQNFIIVDPTYGYNTVSVLAYAKATKSYLLFANKDLIADVVAVLKEVGAKKILVYGLVDEEVIVELNKTGIQMEIINNKDKYDDNMQMVERTLKLTGRRQMIMSDGNAIEESIASGSDPVIFINTLFPRDVEAFLMNKVRDGEVSVFLLIGEEYAQAAYNFKQKAKQELGKEVSIIAKFGEVIPKMGEDPQPNNYVVLPGPVLDLQISAVNYNSKTKRLEVIFKNSGAPVYESSEIIVFVNGQKVLSIIDPKPIYIETADEYGVEYDVQQSLEGEVGANITTRYGMSSKYYEKGFVVYSKIGYVEFYDASNLSIADISTDPFSGDVKVKVENKGEKLVYYRLTTKLVGAKNTTVSDQEIRELQPGESAVISYSGVLKGTEATSVESTAKYGERKAFLKNEATLSRRVATLLDALWLPLLILVVLIAIALYILSKRQK